VARRWAERAPRKRKFHRKRTCRGKVRYRDRAEALAALRTIEQVMANRDKRPRSPYECVACHGVHLTSREG
jgi:hypothetical protein